MPWRRKWQPTPVLLPGKFHGLRSLVGYSPWGRKESDTTEQLHFGWLWRSKLPCYKLPMEKTFLQGTADSQKRTEVLRKTGWQGSEFCQQPYKTGSWSLPVGLSNEIPTLADLLIEALWEIMKQRTQLHCTWNSDLHKLWDNKCIILSHQVHGN